MTASQQRVIDIIRSQDLSEDDIERWGVLLPFFSDEACEAMSETFEVDPENTRLITENLKTKAELIAAGDEEALIRNMQMDEDALFRRLK